MTRIAVFAAAAFCLAAALPAPPALASVGYQLTDPALAARVDSVPLHAFSVDTLWRQARARDPKAAGSRTATLEALVADRLLAAAARKLYGEALQSGQAVAFAPDVALDDQLFATLRSQHGKELEQAMQRLPGGGLDGLIAAVPPLEGAALDALFGQPGKAGLLRLDLALTPEQQARARAIPVLRYRMPDAPGGVVTLYDVYRRQNVQGRVALQGRQPGYIREQAKLALGVLYAQHWARQQFGAAAVDDLRRVLADAETVTAVQRLHGIGADSHADSAVLNQLAAQASQAEIQAYYRKHKEEFVRIEKVKARHIRLADEQAALAVYGDLRDGGDFAVLARRHSRAADAAAGGELGWVRHEGKPDWLAQIVFSQPEGQPSRPIRAPVGPHANAYWEIVLAEQRVLGYQAPDSESVRYIASRSIAREKAVAQLAALRARVLRDARIEINRRELDRPLQLLEPAA